MDTPSENLNHWFKLIENKSVALIGGHDDIEWDVVDSCDLVARVNGHVCRQGGRCDILYYSCADDISEQGKQIFSNDTTMNNLKWAWLNATHELLAPTAGSLLYAKTECLNRGVKNGIYFHAPPRAYELFEVLRNLPQRHLWSKELAERWSFYPLTGVLAAFHLLIGGVLNLYITGMNFYEENGSIPKKAGRHSIPPQIKCLSELKQYCSITNPGVSVNFSPRLGSIINHYQCIA